MAVGQRAFMLFRLLLDVNAEQHAHQPHGEQNTANAKRIGHGVAHPHLIDDISRDIQIAQNLLARPERGRVGYGAGEDAQHDGQRNSEEFVQNGGDQPTHHDDAEGKEIKA